MDQTGETVVVGWIVEGLRWKLKTPELSRDQDWLPMRLCMLITKIGTTLPQVIFRCISRREVEVPLISLLLNTISREVGDLKSMYKYSPVLVHSGSLKSADSNSSADQAESLYSFSKINPALPVRVDAPSNALIVVLRTVLTLCRDLNLRPFWFPEKWSLHWSFRERFIISREFADLMFLLWHHYKESPEVEVKSICLGIIVYIADKVSRDPSNQQVVRPAGKASAQIDNGSDCETSASKTFSNRPASGISVIVPGGKLLPILALSLRILTKDSAINRSQSKSTAEVTSALGVHGQVDVVSSARNQIKRGSKSRQTSTAGASSDNGVGSFENSYNISGAVIEASPIRASDGAETSEAVAALYALKSESVLYTMEGMRQFLCLEESKTIQVQNEHYFIATPLCQSILFLMDQYPTVSLIQKSGLELLLCLCNSNKKNVEILGENCRCIVAAMISWPTDQGVHLTFCTLVWKLANTSERIINALIFHAIYKWLFIPIKYGWTEVAPLACKAVCTIANTVERAQMVGTARICEVLVTTLGKHKGAVALQIEGLRAVLALAKSEICMKKMKADGGKRVLNESRMFLINLLSEDSASIPMGYSRSEIEQIVSETVHYNQLFDKDKCTIS
jgi:hypothetical protein